MEMKSKHRDEVSFLATFFGFLILATTFQGCSSAASQPPRVKKSIQSTADDRFGSAIVFPLYGNVYPLGYYSVSVNIGNPPKVYDLDIDTGSDLTWVQCDAPCTGCTKPRESLYKPGKNIVPCAHPVCNAINSPGAHCVSPTEQCDYEVEYADQGSSLGVLVLDYFPMRLMNSSLARPPIAFGCGYDQKYPGAIPPPPTAGVLGLGNGKASIVSQLNNLGLIRNVFGHCLSGRGGGFLFFGDYLVPSSGIAWTPLIRNSLEKHYTSGPAELVFGGKPTGLKGLELIFDSGSSYTYFNAQAYQTILNLVRNNLKGKPLKDAPEEKALSICWKGAKPFKSVSDVNNFFKPLTLRFTNTKNVHMQLPPQDYLIVTEHGNVCLGILNGTQVGLGNVNVIGDIFLQDKMVIYDNEKQQIGWTYADCKRLPNVDREYSEGMCQPYASNYGFPDEQYSAIYALKKNKLMNRESFGAVNKRRK